MRGCVRGHVGGGALGFNVEACGRGGGEGEGEGRERAKLAGST